MILDSHALFVIGIILIVTHGAANLLGYRQGLRHGAKIADEEAKDED